MKNEIDIIKSWLGSGAINIFGLPFAGKDTHGQILSTQLDANITGGGEILRNQNIPERAKLAMDRGDLIPTEDYLSIVVPYLSQAKFQNKALILSSVGRWHGEEEGIIAGAAQSGHPIKAVIYLQIDPIDAYHRWEKAKEVGDRVLRADDNLENLDNRFKEFMSKTIPVIETYENLGLLIKIDGKPPVESVNTDIIKKLVNFIER